MCDGSRPLQLPDIASWPGIPHAERAYRESVLRDIERRIEADGPREAAPHPDRARQFMPFSALKGYHEMAASKEFVPEPRREMTEERTLALSQAIAGLRKGDVVRVVHYENGGYAETVGAVSEVIEPYRMLRIVRKAVSFDNIWAVEVIAPAELDQASI